MLPAMRQLIVNADDYGAAAGVNAGIVEAFQQGILTSTTVMATGDALDDGLARLRDVPALDTGCHLVLVDGRTAAPAAAVRSLCDADGRFPATLAGLLPRLTAGGLRQQSACGDRRPRNCASPELSCFTGQECGGNRRLRGFLGPLRLSLYCKAVKTWQPGTGTAGWKYLPVSQAAGSAPTSSRCSVM